jgi:CheY-like chemotaxis protein
MTSPVSILIVDDGDVRRALRRLSRDYKVESATCGRRSPLASRTDVVISDLKMPGRQHRVSTSRGSGSA